MNKYHKIFYIIALSFINISIIGYLIYLKSNFFIITPFLYLITFIMGTGWLLTAISISKSKLSIEYIYNKFIPIVIAKEIEILNFVPLRCDDLSKFRKCDFPLELIVQKLFKKEFKKNFYKKRFQNFMVKAFNNYLKENTFIEIVTIKDNYYCSIFELKFYKEQYKILGTSFKYYEEIKKFKLHAKWYSNSSYVMGDKIIYFYKSKLYDSIINNNQGYTLIQFKKENNIFKQGNGCFLEKNLPSINFSFFDLKSKNLLLTNLFEPINNLIKKYNS